MAQLDGQVQDPVGDVTPAATLETPNEPSPAPESGNEGDRVTQETGTPADDFEKKYSESSREARKWKEEAETAKRELAQREQQLLSTVTKTRAGFEEYVDSLNITPREKEYYMNMYDTEIAPGQTPEATDDKDKKATTPVEPVAPPVNPIRETWMNEMDQQTKDKIESRRRASDSFFAKPENRNLSAEEQQAISATAMMLDKRYDYSPEEALDLARTRILSPEAIRDEGYADGVRDTYQAGVSRTARGGKGAISDVVKLPPKDEAFVNYEIGKRGLQGEAADDFRKKYADRVAKRNN